MTIKYLYVPAIFVLRHPTDIGQIIEDLILIAEVADPNEYQDQIYNLSATGLKKGAIAPFFRRILIDYD